MFSHVLDSYKTAHNGMTWPDLWWFKVVVIAIPIGGSIVLVAVVLVAMRILRRDKCRQRLCELHKSHHHREHVVLAKPDLLLAIAEEGMGGSDTTSNSSSNIDNVGRDQNQINTRCANY